MIQLSRHNRLYVAGVVALAAAAAARGVLPVSGVPVPELQAFENAMQQFMAANDLRAGVLAISRGQTIIYQRGFGYLHPDPDTTTVPENTPMRIASCEKTLTAAAIQRLIIDGLLNMSDFAFELGQPGGGILPHTPWQSLGDARLPNVTVANLLAHQGGWDRSTANIGEVGRNPWFGDPQLQSAWIAEQMGIALPAQRDDIIRFMLSQPLEFMPGTAGCADSCGVSCCYSNFGYMVLGRIVQQVSGQNFDIYVRSKILTPDMWVPNQEIIYGRTYDAYQSFREPTYIDSSHCEDVSDPDGDEVWCPYGGWNQEAMVGHGNLVVSAAPLLVYMDRYQVGIGGGGNPLPPLGTFGTGAHSGGLPGSSSVMWQRGSDGINVVVLFNEWIANIGDAPAMAILIDNMITAGGITWPTFAVDGFWVDFDAPPAALEVGGYNHPFRTVNQALTVGDGAKLRLMPGSTSWTGTINQKVRMDAPYGLARIGA